PRSPIRPTQPPCLNPSSPAGSWMTPSSVTFSVTMIFPNLVLLSGVITTPAILRKKFEELGVLARFSFRLRLSVSGSSHKSRVSLSWFYLLASRSGFSIAEPPSLIGKENGHENNGCHDAEAQSET